MPIELKFIDIKSLIKIFSFENYESITKDDTHYKIVINGNGTDADRKKYKDLCAFVKSKYFLRLEVKTDKQYQFLLNDLLTESQFEYHYKRKLKWCAYRYFEYKNQDDNYDDNFWFLDYLDEYENTFSEELEKINQYEEDDENVYSVIDEMIVKLENNQVLNELYNEKINEYFYRGSKMNLRMEGDTFIIKLKKYIPNRFC